jgi:hypothetical protein
MTACMTEFPSTTETTKMRKGEEVAMRIRKAFLSAVVAASVGLMLAGTAAMAQDPDPSPDCTTTNGWALHADGPTVGPCLGDDTKTCTLVTYTVQSGPSSTPDHVATFVRGEVSIASTNPVTAISNPCDGDSAIGMPSNVDCHETLVRWNNQQSKSQMFQVEGEGARAPIATSVVVKKGNSVGSCAIAGLGLEATSPLATATPSLDEVLGGRCKVRVESDRPGHVTHVTALSSDCTVEGPFPIGSIEIQVNGDPNTPFPVPVEFAEGFNFILGNGSCTYKQYYPTTGPVYRICY